MALRKAIVLLCVLPVFLLYCYPVFAEEKVAVGIANYLPILDKDVKDGDIISFSPRGYFVTKTSYDTSVVGVVAEKPAVSINLGTNASNSHPVIFAGNARVRVSGEGGAIKKGELITTSTKAGVGMKALKSGYIIGSALEDYSPSNSSEVKLLNMSLNVHYYYSPNVRTGILDIFKLSALATYEQPTVVFRYFVAGVIVITSFVLGFLSFGRVANTGVEALGRNPLAHKTIQLGILLNVTITVAIILAGLAMAFFVLRL